MTDAPPPPSPVLHLPCTHGSIADAARAMAATTTTGLHLLIDSAAPPSAGFNDAWERLQPAAAAWNDLLQKMQQLSPMNRALQADLAEPHIADQAATLNTPFEHALAQALGLPGGDGALPWAAAQQGIMGPYCAWLQATHWQVGTDRIVLGHPADLALAADESQALMSSMQPYLSDDGLQVDAIAPGLWLAQGDLLRGLRSASLDRVVGRSIDAWLPDAATPAGARVRRLMNEMQMLLYTHPVQDARQARGLAPVNSLWVHGAGQITQTPTALQAAQATPARHAVVGLTALRDAARHGPDEWQTAWAQSVAALAPLVQQRLASGQPTTVTLCGESACTSWGAGPAHPPPAPAGLWHKLRLSLSKKVPLRPLDQLKQL
jgi:hypothetical protein